MKMKMKMKMKKIMTICFKKRMVQLPAGIADPMQCQILMLRLLFLISKLMKLNKIIM
jgi:hypothetical protein